MQWSSDFRWLTWVMLESLVVTTTHHAELHNCQPWQYKPNAAVTRIVSPSDYTPTGEQWYICSFNAQPEAPAFFAVGPERAGASGWALNESISTGSGIH